jgi:hypothetical protein
MVRHCLVVLCFLVAVSLTGYAQKEKEYETVIVVYSEEQGYGWKAEEKVDKIGQLLGRILANVLEKPDKDAGGKQTNRLLMPLAAKDKAPYTALVTAQLRGGLSTSASKTGDLAVQFELSRIFYTVRIVVESATPLRSARLAIEQPGSDEEQKYPAATIIAEQPQTKVDATGVRMNWSYTLLWKNILLDSRSNSVPYRLVYADNDKPETQEIKLPLAQKANSFLYLGEKNFPLPAMQWKADDGGSGQLAQMELSRQKSGLYQILATWTWKNVRPRSSLNSQEFLCELGSEGVTLRQQQFAAASSQPLGSDHFVAFRCLYKPFQQLARQQGDKDILFKHNVILIDYDEFNFVVRVALPNIELPEDAYCWVIYPSKDQQAEWVPIEPQKLSDKRYVFMQPFPARGNLYNLALQLKNRPLRQNKVARQLYIDVPIGTPQEELGRYADKNIEAWGVPWKKSCPGDNQCPGDEHGK